MKNATLLILFILGTTLLYAQDANIIWQRTIGGSGNDSDAQIIETNDGGVLIGGTSNSNISAEKTENSRGGNDFWLVKLTSGGEIEWQKTIGGSGNDFLRSISITDDGNYLIGGVSDSPISGEKTEDTRGGDDYWILKVSSSGSIIWQKTIGGSEADNLSTVLETEDGGYILYGHSFSSISGDRTINPINGTPDLWLIKLNIDLSFSFQKSHGFNTSFRHFSTNLDINENGDYIISASFNVDGSQEFLYVSRVAVNGNRVWDELYGGDGREYSPHISSTSQGNTIVAGTSDSNISGNKTEDSNGGLDLWILELDSNGAINWQNTIGGSFGDQSISVSQTQDGGYIISSYSISDASGDKTEDSKGSFDYWILKLNNTGIIEWQNTLGGASSDRFPSIIEDSNGDYVVAGASFSDISADKSENSRGGFDYWILKLNSTLGLDESPLFKNFTVYPNPAKDKLQLSAKDITVDAVKIFSTKGELIKTIEGFSGTTAVDVSQLSAGVYFLQITADNKIVTKKFVKE